MSTIPCLYPKLLKKKRTDSHCSLTRVVSMSKEANEKEQRSTSSRGGLHVPSWATPRPPTCTRPSPRRLCGTACRAPSAGPPSSDCYGARTPRWGSEAFAPGNTVHRRACPTCWQNSSSFWLLGDTDPALSWWCRVSPGHLASHWWWGPGQSRRSMYSSPGRTGPCLYLRNKQYSPHVSKRPVRWLQCLRFLCFPSELSIAPVEEYHRESYTGTFQDTHSSIFTQ